MRTMIRLGGFLVCMVAALALFTSCSESANTPAPENPAQPEESRIVSDEMELRVRAQAIHDRVLVLDAHADIEVPGKESPYVGPDGRSRVAPDKMAEGDVNAVVLSIAVGLFAHASVQTRRKRHT